MELAHVSDLHVRGPSLGPWTGLLSKRWIGALNGLWRDHPLALLERILDDLRRRPPDHLAVTGDLTNTTLEGELARACRALAGVVEPARLSIVPGNHDAYVRAPVRARRFEHHVAPLLGLAPEALVWPRVQRVPISGGAADGDLALVSLNSAVPTPWFTAYGRLGAEQLARLDEALAAPAARRVVLVHHPPVQGDGRPDRPWRRNRDGAALLARCLARGVDLVLCGHTHAPFRHRLARPDGRPLWVVCAGSSTRRARALGRGGTYHRYWLEPDGPIRLDVRGLDPSTGRVEQVESVALT